MPPATNIATPARPGPAVHPLVPLVHWTFRIALFMELVGHGAFGLMGGKAAWVPYFGVVGIGETTAWRLMPLVGVMDVALGILALVWPMRAVILYGVVWGFWTALLRPLSGEAVWETLERAGNYGVPLAFLLWSGWPRRASEWFSRIDPRTVATGAFGRVALTLRISLAMLLIGHGAFGAFMNKEMLVQQWETLGIHGAVGGMPIVPAAGWLDIALGVAVLAHPGMWLLAFVAVWKIACELLYPMTGAPVWEFIERGGSYAAPLVLMLLLSMKRAPRPARSVEIPAESAPA